MGWFYVPKRAMDFESVKAVQLQPENRVFFTVGGKGLAWRFRPVDTRYSLEGYASLTGTRSR